MITQRTHVEGLGEVATSSGNLAENVRDLRGRLISVRNDAYSRLRTAGAVNLGKSEGTRVAVEFDYLRGEVPVAKKYDKLSLKMAERAVKADSQGKYLCTDSTERCDKNAKTAEKEEKSGVPYEKRTAILLPRQDFLMSPNENPNYFAFFLEDLAEREGENSYFVLNGKNPIRVYLINKAIVDGERDTRLLENPNGTIVVPYGWFGSLDFRSGLDGYGRDLGCNSRARGVLEKTSEAGLPKNLRTDVLETRVSDALKRKRAFEYNGILYVPVSDKRVSLKQ